MLDIGKLSETNHWWKLGSVKKELAPELKRDMFQEVLNYLNERQIIAVVGLRRTGKTTLFYQVIEHLLGKKVESKNIMYFSFDESVEELDEIINIYQEKVLGKGIGEEKVYLFLDEVQKLKDWQNKVKLLYDLNPKIKIFVSGSASLNILLGGKETLAGRIFYFHLDLLSFSEFLQFRSLKLRKIKDSPYIWEKELKIEMNNYLSKPFPEIVNAKEEVVRKYVKESIIEKALFRDLSFLFAVKDVELIEKLVRLLASNPGMTINLEDLSKDLGGSRQVLSNYLYYLECCFVIKSLKNFRGSFKASSRKLKRYYLSHPALALALASPEPGRVAENLVAFKTKAEYFWRERNYEVDFVTGDKKIMPIEVKNRKEILQRDIKGLLKFMSEFNVKKGLVISTAKEGEETIHGKKVTYIPLWKWLLTG